jgi:uncharacterized protein YhbP (UPF0306 family)
MVEGEEGLARPIIKFLKRNHIASIATQDWSFSCFYAYYEADPHLLFLSDNNTAHAQLLLQNPRVSGTIAKHTRTVAHIQGVQLVGEAFIADDSALRSIYNKRFPFAAISAATLWAVRLDLVKYTSNIVTFGKKIEWRRGR